MSRVSRYLGGVGYSRCGKTPGTGLQVLAALFLCCPYISITYSGDKIATMSLTFSRISVCNTRTDFWRILQGAIAWSRPAPCATTALRWTPQGVRVQQSQT